MASWCWLLCQAQRPDVLEDRFPYEQSPWAPEQQKAERWLSALERTGVENVRSRLGRLAHGWGSAASISIGTEQAVTVGFIQEWLAWHNSKKAAQERNFRAAQIFATRWAAGAATVAAIAGAIGWAWTILHK
jgi:hypothetical protein